MNHLFLNALPPGVNGWEALSPSGAILVPTIDDQSRVIVTNYSHRQGLVNGRVPATALGAGGTVTLIAAVGASFIGLLGWELHALGATVLTLESPAASVLWGFSVAAGLPVIISRSVPLYGALGAAWILRTSAATTITANAHGIAHK